MSKDYFRGYFGMNKDKINITNKVMLDGDTVSWIARYDRRFLGIIRYSIEKDSFVFSGSMDYLPYEEIAYIKSLCRDEMIEAILLE